MAPDLPGQQRDAADQWMLDNQLTSRQRILQHRLKITGEEAEEQVEMIAAELLREAQLMAPILQTQMASTQLPATPAPDATSYDEEEELDNATGQTSGSEDDPDAGDRESE
jgi:hypothetical protein